MRDYGTPITTEAHFPNARVYRRDDPDGPVYTIVFRNLELRRWPEVTAIIFAQWLIVMLLLQFYPVTGLITLFLGLPALGLYLNIHGPMRRHFQRRIEIRQERDEMRFFRSRRLMGSYPLSALAYLTVEDHPDAERARIDRQERGVKGPGTRDYVHCLFGWFGIGGANKVVLMERAEWPARQSLHEIREALEWTRKRAAAGEDRTQRTETGETQTRARRAQGAPLD